ncbi:MAG TPA: NUDIX domain-containing protein [Dehalococcoidales bacterium]
MNAELKAFLASGTLISENKVMWGGEISLRISYYLGNENPPIDYVSSVRAIVFHDNSVLVVKEKNGQLYITPGGRVEPGEKLDETLRREVLEETGWTLSITKPLGFMHFHHLSSKPLGYRYPYPDFIWPIYLAEAGEFVPYARVPDDYALMADLLLIDEVRKLPIEKVQLMLLEAAIKLR